MVDAFYATENEDEEFLSYQGKVDETAVNPDRVDQPGLIDSGYHAVGVIWPNEPSIDYISPWEVSVRSPDSSVALPSRPRLDDDDKRTIRDTLNHLRSMPEVVEAFGLPVSETYIDYPCRVELPIDLSFVAERVEADYYATKFSFVADIRLIVTNCVKYNGEGEPLCFTAQHMLDEAMNRVLNEMERDWFRAYDDPLPEPQPTGNLLRWERTDEEGPVEEPVPAQRRHTQQNLSSFENITQADENTRRSSRAVRPPRRLVDTQASPSRRSSRRMPSGQPHHTRNTRAASRSVLEGPVRTLEQLSSRNGVTLRGRSAGHRGRMGRNQQANTFLRRSSRNRHENPIHQSTRPGLRNSQPSRDAVHQRSNQTDSSEVRLNVQRRLAAPVRLEEAPFADEESSSEEAHSEEEYAGAGDAAETSSDESATKEAQSSQQRTRPQRQARRKETSDRESLDSDVTAKLQRKGVRKRKAVGKASKTGDSDSEMDDVMGNKPTESPIDDEEEYHQGSSDELESDDDEEESANISAASDDDSIENRVVPKRRREAPSRSAPRPAATVKREPPRKRSRQSKDNDVALNDQKSRTRGVRAVYEDPSSSDFDDESDEHVTPTDRKPPVTKKRKGIGSNRNTAVFAHRIFLIRSRLERCNKKEEDLHSETNETPWCISVAGNCSGAHYQRHQ